MLHQSLSKRITHGLLALMAFAVCVIIAIYATGMPVVRGFFGDIVVMSLILKPEISLCTATQTDKNYSGKMIRIGLLNHLGCLPGTSSFRDISS